PDGDTPVAMAHASTRLLDQGTRSPIHRVRQPDRVVREEARDAVRMETVALHHDARVAGANPQGAMRAPRQRARCLAGAAATRAPRAPREARLMPKGRGDRLHLGQWRS